MVLILLHPVLGHLNLGSHPYLLSETFLHQWSLLLSTGSLSYSFKHNHSFFILKKKSPNQGFLGFKLPNSFYFRPCIFFASQVSIDVVCMHSLHSPGWLHLFSFTLQSTVVRLLSPSLYRHYSQQGHSLPKTIWWLQIFLGTKSKLFKMACGHLQPSLPSLPFLPALLSPACCPLPTPTHTVSSHPTGLLGAPQKHRTSTSRQWCSVVVWTRLWESGVRFFPIMCLVMSCW